MTGSLVDHEGAIESFDLLGELPSGTTVLEASAGTGKTYAIAALAARYLAEGTAELSELMLVTFGRNATDELRMRVRERLVDTEQGLAAVLASGGGALEPTDEVTAFLRNGPIETVRQRHERIADALANFDAATIATTHEFCTQMLAGLGILGDQEPDAIFVESLTDLTREVAADTYLRFFAGADSLPPFEYPEALRLAEQVINFGDGPLVPEDAAEGSEAWARLAYAEEVRTEVERRKRQLRLFTYDDMLTRLRDALVDRGPAAADRLRSRFKIVLVDEFQDTDPVQWEILRTAFHDHSTLILIGDPKQAIYAFRGADVFSYLIAVKEAGARKTLDTNWRSDQALVTAVDSLFAGAALGDPEIVVREVKAQHTTRRLVAGEGSALFVDEGQLAPIRVRVHPHDPEAERLPSVGIVRPKINKDLVADIAALLASGFSLDLPDGKRSVTPADVAILVRTNDRGEALRDALTTAGIPAVLIGSSSVFASDLAAEWLRLLRALEQPRQALVRDAALTCFVGWSFTQLAKADDGALTELSQTMRWWSRLLHGQGVAALIEAITSQTRLSKRLLSRINGERQLTDLRHIGQSLHAAMTSGQLGVSALVKWLGERMDEAKINSLNDRTRRLETDADAVQILTVHRSKGLQFPIVYLPDAWDRFVPSGRDDGAILRLHQPIGADQGAAPDLDGGVERVLDIGGAGGPSRSDRLGRYRREEAGEDLRLLYVAATRAQCQVVTWWAPSWNTPNSALQRLLYGPRRPGVEPELRYEVTGDPQLLPHLSAPDFSVEMMGPREIAHWQPPAGPASALQARRFDRELDLAWRRTSYSGLTAAAHGLDLPHTAIGSEAEVGKDDDESILSGALSDLGFDHDHFGGDPAMQTVSPMTDLPSGAAFGTVVHGLFERLDPRAEDLPAALRQAAAIELSRVPAGTMTVSGLSEALQPSLLTPLGPLANQLRLCDIAVGDRLAELDFEYPLAGGDHPAAQLTLGQLAPVLRRHLLADDPLATYADRLEHPILAAESLRGYLNGSIDAVLRVPGDGAEPRYLVVDYKTNWLGDFDGTPLRVGHYAPPLLAEAMMDAHYPLQALLYGVAVHRFLRWRQPGYQPDVHLGGVLYLFLRGMAGPDTPLVDGVPCGVFSWRPPSELIMELSDLLDRGPL